MKAADPRHIVRAYRDLALLDREDRHCGVVDDIEMARGDGGVWEMTALLVGSGAWRGRWPHWFTTLLPGRKLVRIDAADVASTGSAVHLLKKADELGLACVEHRLLRKFHAD
jgi:hypothetical protein